MAERSGATHSDAAASKQTADREELSLEELGEVSGGTGGGKRSAYNNAQQPWQATID